MKYCTKCGAELADGVAFCPTCGTKVEETQTQTPAQTAGKLHCPHCKSFNFNPITESSVTGALSTHHGGFTNTSVSNIHRNYWMCSDCGTKFRNIQNLEEEIQKSRNTPKIMLILGIIGAVFSVILLLQTSQNPLTGFFMTPILIGAIVATVVFFIFHFSYKKKLAQMEQELEYLKVNCFN